MPIYPTNANSEICEKSHKGIGVVGEHFIGVAGVNLIFNCEYYFLLGCSCVHINIVSLCSFHSVHNTIYLEVHCPAVRPHLVVVSDSGRSVVDFANVSLGKIKKYIVVLVSCVKGKNLPQQKLYFFISQLSISVILLSTLTLTPKI